MRYIAIITSILILSSCAANADKESLEIGAPGMTESEYNGVYFKRGNLVVSDLDRSFKIWIDLFGMQIDSVNSQTPDSLAYDLFNAPKIAETRFATLNAGPRQMRTLGIYEVKGVPYEAQQGIRRGGVVMNANGRLDQIRAALPGLGLRMLREKKLTSDGQGSGIETGFYDWDGNLIVLYELPNAKSP